jgi:hypothetical protein
MLNVVKDELEVEVLFIGGQQFVTLEDFNLVVKSAKFKISEKKTELAKALQLLKELDSELARYGLDISIGETSVKDRIKEIIKEQKC